MSERHIPLSSCIDCPYCDHSGSYTVGGPWLVCHSPKVVDWSGLQIDYNDPKANLKWSPPILPIESPSSRKYNGKIPNWCPLPSMPDNSGLISELEEFRDSIARQPEDCFGSVPDTPTEQGWWLRDELVHNVTKIINNYEGAKENTDVSAQSSKKESSWVSVEDRLPPYNWHGLVLSDVRVDRPVMAHRADENYETNFPYAGVFIGKWREALLIGDHLREKAKVTHWLETDKLYPDPPVGDDS